MSTALRLRIISILLLAGGILLLFWWPLSHWFYSDFYHNLLGFKPGSYPDPMVKIIGSCGVLPVMMMLLAGLNPQKNRNIIALLVLFSLIIGMTYFYLILSAGFPEAEYWNAALCLITAFVLLIIYPWKRTNE